MNSFNHSVARSSWTKAAAFISAMFLLLVNIFGGQSQQDQKGTEKAMIKKLSPVLYVEAIEPCLPFWDRLGFQKVAEVPEGDKLGFVILVKDGVEVMYQSRASLAKDIPSLANSDFKSSTVLYMEVSNLEEVLGHLKDAEVVVPKRKTFYGASEIFVREPGGNVIAFAAH